MDWFQIVDDPPHLDYVVVTLILPQLRQMLLVVIQITLAE